MDKDGNRLADRTMFKPCDYADEGDQRGTVLRSEASNLMSEIYRLRASLRQLAQAHAQMADALRRLIACYEVSHSSADRMDAWTQARSALALTEH